MPKQPQAVELPRVGVGVVIWRGDKVLLVKRRNPPHQGQWSLPGGKQQWGETIFAAAVREAREETGLDITPLGIVTAIDAITHDKAAKIEYHYTIVEVMAEAGEGEPKAADDAADVRWATLQDIAILCDWPEVERVVRLAALQRAL
jgi:ADP-ribose pyrophosphatase YjhB (NUDIX family)